MSRAECRSTREVPCPGALPYDERYSDRFYGRDREIGVLLDLVRGQRLSVLDAASASGKTSLLQAGLVPALRAARFRWAPGGVSTIPVFPLLLNQWLGRRSAGRNQDFAGLFVEEALRALQSCRRSYEAQSNSESALAGATDRELQAIARALRGLARISTSFPRSSNRSHAADRALVQRLMTALDVLTGAFGSVLLLLDQFEEILGDPLLGRQAIAATESIFLLRKDDVRQLLSLRNDALHLLAPLEARSVLESKRRISLHKLGPEAVKSIVLQMSRNIDVGWEDAALARLIGTFTSFPGDGSPGLDVNLLGLLVVLPDLFTEAIQWDIPTLTRNTLREYCQRYDLDSVHTSITGELIDRWIRRDPRTAGYDKRVDPLLSQAPSLAWIDSSLESEGTATKPDAALPGLVKPMVMRMADWLVTPSGFKRPMTLGELKGVAYLQDMRLAGRRRAGRALLENWTWTAVEERLEKTCTDALDRLVARHVLKKRMAEVENDSTYELVHDQFGAPLVEWSRRFRDTPAADLGSPYAIADRVFPWKGDLAALVSDRRLLAAVWVGCALRDVDFSRLSFVRCDFSRTLFRRCRFTGAELDGCDLTQAKFEGCEFAGTSFRNSTLKDVAFAARCTLTDATLTECILNGALFDDHCKLTDLTLANCDLDRVTVRGRSELQRVSVVGGQADSIELSRIALEDCSFHGDVKRPLLLRNMQLIDVESKGKTGFKRCTLSGATIGATRSQLPVLASALGFDRCDLQGAEIKNLDFTDGSLRITGGTATGAVFDRVKLPQATGQTLRAEFDNVVLTGAVFLGCEIRSTRFSGTGRNRAGVRPTEAKTLVFRDVGSGRQAIPSILGDVDFVGLDLENAAFLRCRFAGPVTFRDCYMAGGALTGSRRDPSHQVEGLLKFDRCSLTAAEMTSLDFVGEKLEVSGSSAAGAYFSDVTFTPGKTGGRSGRFVATEMPGALFDGCQIHGVRFEGTPGHRAPFATFTVRQRPGAKPGAPATLGDCEFSHLLLDNLSIEGVAIDGDLAFRDCVLDGGTFGGQDPKRPMLVAGKLNLGDCECNALEFSNVQFKEGARLLVKGGSCRGALFHQVSALGSAPLPGISLDGPDLSGAVFLGCTLGSLRLRGKAGTGKLVPAWGLIMRGRSTRQRSHLGDVTIEGFDCDGGSFRDLALGGRLRFLGCSLLRVELSGLVRTRRTAAVDVRESDVLYAEIDRTLLAAAGGAKGKGRSLLVIGPGQLEAAKHAEEGRRHLRYKDRKC